MRIAHEQVTLYNQRPIIGVKAILTLLLFAAALGAFAFACSWVLNLPVGTRIVLEPHYTKAPIAWEGAVIRDGTTHTWGFRWPPRAQVTQVQYSLKNLDSVEGLFIVGVVFDNGEVSKDVQRDVDLAPAQEATLIFDSPLRGKSKYRIGVSVPNKLVAGQREVAVPRTLGDLISGK